MTCLQPISQPTTRSPSPDRRNKLEAKLSRVLPLYLASDAASNAATLLRIRGYTTVGELIREPIEPTIALDTAVLDDIRAALESWLQGDEKVAEGRKSTPKIISQSLPSLVPASQTAASLLDVPLQAEVPPLHTTHVSTGVLQLDERFKAASLPHFHASIRRSGIVRGESVEIVGPPNTGKTALVVQIAITERCQAVIEEYRQVKAEEASEDEAWAAAAKAPGVLIVDTEGGISAHRLLAGICAYIRERKELHDSASTSTSPDLLSPGGPLVRAILGGIFLARSETIIDLIALLHTLGGNPSRLKRDAHASPTKKRRLEDSAQSCNHNPTLEELSLIVIDSISNHARSPCPLATQQRLMAELSTLAASMRRESFVVKQGNPSLPSTRVPPTLIVTTQMKSAFMLPDGRKSVEGVPVSYMDPGSKGVFEPQLQALAPRPSKSPSAEQMTPGLSRASNGKTAAKPAVDEEQQYVSALGELTWRIQLFVAGGGHLFAQLFHSAYAPRKPPPEQSCTRPSWKRWVPFSIHETGFLHDTMLAEADEGEDRSADTSKT